ncbi:hypothetical protein M3J09_003990 [Ascochyta lentis]
MSDGCSQPQGVVRLNARLSNLEETSKASSG